MKKLNELIDEKVAHFQKIYVQNQKNGGGIGYPALKSQKGLPEKLANFIKRIMTHASYLRFPETVICAAVMVKDTERVFYGHRHHNALEAMRDNLSWTMNRKQITALEVEQGFVTTTGRFVTREEGRKLQDEAGIKSKNKEGYMPGTLFSEDLY